MALVDELPDINKRGLPKFLMKDTVPLESQRSKYYF